LQEAIIDGYSEVDIPPSNDFEERNIKETRQRRPDSTSHKTFH
jgi:hypothetical protein